MAKQTVFYKELADKIGKLMEEQGISRKNVAEHLGISQPILSRFFLYGEKLPAERINQMLDLVGYELAPVEKKKLHHAQNGVIQRLKDLKASIEDAMLAYSLNSPQIIPDNSETPAASEQHGNGEEHHAKA